jgi:hypothetical protein
VDGETLILWGYRLQESPCSYGVGKGQQMQLRALETKQWWDHFKAAAYWDSVEGRACEQEPWADKEFPRIQFGGTFRLGEQGNKGAGEWTRPCAFA